MFAIPTCENSQSAAQMKEKHSLQYMDSWITLRQTKKTVDEYIATIAPLYVTRKTRKSANGLRNMAVQTQTPAKHRSALHFAIRCGMPREVIVFMLVRSEVGISKLQDHEGKTPLHYAAIHADADVIELVGAWSPQSALVRDFEGFTPLHLSIQRNRKSSAIIAVARVNIKCVQQCVGQTHQRHAKKTSAENAGNTPLHLALLANSEFKVLRFLLEAFPAAVVVSNQDGCLPIHVALKTYCSPQTIELMTADCSEICAQSLLTNNSQNFLAVEYAIHMAVGLEICTILIRRTKDCIQRFSQLVTTDVLSACLDDTVDRSTSTLSMSRRIKLAMYMIKYEVEINTMELYMAEFPNDGVVRTKNGFCTLLHFAAMLKVSVSILEKVYCSMPVACYQQCDSNGNSPLHYLLYNRYVVGVLDASVFPEIAMASHFPPLPMKTSRRHVMQYLLHESIGEDHVEYLVSKWPDSVSLRNDNNQTVLDLAVFSYCPLPVIKLLFKKDKSLFKHVGYGGNSIVHNMCARINLEHVMKTCNAKNPSGVVLEMKEDFFFDTLSFESTDRVEIFSWICSLHESMAHLKNDKGQIPLHVAIENHAETGMVQKLVNRHTKHTLLAKDKNGNTAAHLQLRWEMAAFYVHDKTLVHITATDAYSGETLLGLLKNMVLSVCKESALAKRDPALLHATLRKTCFISDVVRTVVARCNAVEVLAPENGIFRCLDGLLGITTEQVSPPLRTMYMKYYAAIVSSVFKYVVLCSHNRNLQTLEMFRVEFSKQLAQLDVGQSVDQDAIVDLRKINAVLLDEIDSIKAEKTQADIANQHANELILQETQSVEPTSFSKSRRNRRQKPRPLFLAVDAVSAKDDDKKLVPPDDAEANTSPCTTRHVAQTEVEKKTPCVQLEETTTAVPQHQSEYTQMAMRYDALMVQMLKSEEEHQKTKDRLHTVSHDACIREKDHERVVQQLRTVTIQAIENERRHTLTQHTLDDSLQLVGQHEKESAETKKLIDELLWSKTQRDHEHAVVVTRLEQTASEWFIRSTCGKLRETMPVLPKCTFCTACAVFCEHGAHTCVDCINILYTNEIQ